MDPSSFCPCPSPCSTSGCSSVLGLLCSPLLSCSAGPRQRRLPCGAAVFTLAMAVRDPGPAPGHMESLTTRFLFPPGLQGPVTAELSERPPKGEERVWSRQGLPCQDPTPPEAAGVRATLLPQSEACGEEPGGRNLRTSQGQRTTLRPGASALSATVLPFSSQKEKLSPKGLGGQAGRSPFAPSAQQREPGCSPGVLESG